MRYPSQLQLAIESIDIKSVKDFHINPFTSQYPNIHIKT